MSYVGTVWLFAHIASGNKQLILYLKVLLLLPLYPVQQLLLLHFLPVVILFAQTLVLRKCQHLVELTVWCMILSHIILIRYYICTSIGCSVLSSKVGMQRICRLACSFLWNLKKGTYALWCNWRISLYDHTTSHCQNCRNWDQVWTVLTHPDKY